ncbi:MAG: aminoacetone oxidase family FAD-binding enzyme [Phycisphaerales bacterium]|nr:aminoacetone oxidase family FAD-binding enzyme [Phycisphaerales bacterium]
MEESGFEVLVVGAGAAGQMAAIAAAEQGRRVGLLEQMDRPGLKILASGGGRCNLTNLVTTEEFIAAFGRSGRFTGPALAQMGPAMLRTFMDRLGVATITPDGCHVYPAGERATEVQNALRRRLDELGVELHTRTEVIRLRVESGRLRGVETKIGHGFAAERVVLSCGGRSWPRLGGTGGGYALAEQAGHKLVEPLPALVPLVTRETWPSRLAGVSLSNARVRIDHAGQSRVGLVGDVLFTHRGLSGPVALDLSGTVAGLLRRYGTVSLRIALIAGMNASRWAERLDEWRKETGRRGIASMLREYLPASMGSLLVELAGVKERTPVAQLTAGQRDTLADLLGGIELTVTDTEGFETAFVTRGGVVLGEVRPDTLESRRLPGLYLAGELLDLDGPCGGYNLQWAFASGYLAGRSAGQ